MHTDPLVFTIFLIFTGAAILATVALFARQALLVIYIVLGMLFGPWGLGLVDDPVIIEQIGHVGIMFLLFLLGLNLHPQKLWKLFQQTTQITAISSLLFACVGSLTAWAFGFSALDSLFIGATLMFSSTIIGLKLLPTRVLHHQRMGEIIISVLLLQDILAVIILLLVRVRSLGQETLIELGLLVFSLPALFLAAYYFERYVLIQLIARFEKIQEYIFLLAIGWCLGMAELATHVGLSPEIGAFMAGVALATNQISRFIAETLKPLRDFFLVMFFFSLGANFNLQTLRDVLVPATLLAALSLLLKPLVFTVLFRRVGESRENALEIGVRLGQLSEFAFLIAVMAADLEVISSRASFLIQTCALLTFIVSPYLVVLNYPTPIAVSDRLRRD